MNQSIFYEKLNDRDLWVDGTESLNVNGMCHEILSGNYDFVDGGTISEDSAEEVNNFIKMSDISINKKPLIKTKDSLSNLDTSFNIPEQYLEADIEKVLVSGFKRLHDLSSMDESEKDARLFRLADELELYNNMGLFDVLKCGKYIVDVMKANNIVWGPGRGSACCSYVLYLLEIHDIDSFYYDLSIDEFLR